MSTPTLNPPSLRFPFELVGHPREIVEAHRFAFNGLLDLNQAVRALNTKVNTNTTSIAAAATTVNTVTQIISNALPGLGTVNDQTGQTSYITVPSDNGAFLILSDASPVAVTLTIPSSGQPWMMFTMNWGAGLVTFTPASPASISYIGNLLASSMTLAQGYQTLIVFDGFNFYAATLPRVPVFVDSEHVTITAGSGTLANTPNPASSLQFYAWNTGFGATLLIQGVDYNLAGAVITLTGTAPPAVGGYYAFYRI